MKPKKLLSLFLAVVMLLSMLPAVAFGTGEADLPAAGVYTGEGEDLMETPDDSPPSAGEAQENIAITAFAPISLDAGVAGSAAYESADGVINYLNANYASVTAHTYGGGTVAVPVAGWKDTDTYDPATAGSYTFTAVLGNIPAGYTVGAGVTATTAVVVAEADFENATLQEPSDTVDKTAMAAPTAEGDTIADGAYTLPVSLWHAANDAPSMGNAALEQTGKLVVEDGRGTLQLTFKPLTFMGMTGYLSQMDLLDNILFNENNYPVEYDLLPAAVISNYDVVDDFNKPDSSDPNCAGKPYPKDLSVPVVLEQEYTWVHVYVPVMGSLGFGDQVARIKLDWNNLNPEGQEDIEITGFDPITVEAGVAGSATYADAAAVIEYLNTNYDSVTAQVYGGGTVSVPVTEWMDTNSYNPDTAASYTFTATLGQLPEGYTNPNNLTATVEVVLSAAGSTVTKVTVNPYVNEEGLANFVLQGQSIQLSATVTGENNPSPAVTWSISGHTSENTAINSQTGLLTAGADETSAAIQVTAASVQDPSQSGILSIRAMAVTEFKITTDPEVTPVTPGTQTIINASVTVTNIPAGSAGYAYRGVKWLISGNTSENTVLSAYSISGCTLTVGADEEAATLTLTAVSKADSSKTAAITLNVVVIPDTTLHAALCAAMGKDPAVHTITVADMQGLTELDLSDKGLTNLKGLWTAVNLEKLNLSRNPLTKNVTASNQYNEVLKGIENLVKLKELDLSRCDLGINKTNAYAHYNQTSPPRSIIEYGVCQLPNLEKLDLSANKMKGEFTTFSQPFAKLSELDLSGNYLNAAYMPARIFPVLASVNFSGNYLYVDESEAFYKGLVDFGIDKFAFDNRRNLAELFSLKVSNAGATSDYFIEEGVYTVDAGTVLGDNLTFACLAYSSDNTVKVTVNGEKYTAVMFKNASPVYIPLNNLEIGKDHSVRIEVMHLSGDIRTYTLRFKTKALPAGGEDSAGIVDANLQYAVCTKLGKDPAAYVVTKADMAGLSGALSASVTNAEGLQYAAGGLTSLSLSGTYTSLPDLSSLVNITSLTIGSPNLTAIPSLSGLTKLQTINISGVGPGLTIPAGLDTCEALTAFSVSNSDAFDFSGLEAAPALTQLRVNNCRDFILPEALKALNTLATLEITNCDGLTQLPASLAALTQLQTLILTGNQLADFPDLSGLTDLTSLNLSNNAFTDIPGNIAKLSGLQTLSMRQNSMPAVTADLSPLVNLKTMDLYMCGLTEFPATILDLASLESLDMSSNSLQYITGSMAGLQKLTSLNLNRNRLHEFPAGIKDLAALTSLRIENNYYTDLPADLADYLHALTSLRYGGYIRYGASTSAPDPESNAAAVAAALRSRIPAVTVTLSQSGGFRFSELRTLEWDFGEITQIHDALNPAESQEYSLRVPGDTTSLTFTLTAMLDDTAITVNGVPVANKGSVEVPVVKGLNSVQIVCYNSYAGLSSTATHSTTYKLTISVGSPVGEDFPAEGREYSIDLRLWHRELPQHSMADSYFAHKADMTYSEGRFAVYVTTTKASWITQMSYRNAAGEYVEAERVSRDTAADTAVYRLYVEEDALEEDFYISPYVVPMGYAPICRIIFDTDSIIDITDEEPQPGDLVDGEYTIDADALKEHADELSMTNQFLTEPAKLTVAGGQITLTMVWHGTSLIPMTMVEGLWYQDSTEEFVEITRDIDAGANTLTFSMPLTGITEPVMMKVYAPEGMGDSYPLFRLVFNEETLTPVTEEERAVYTLMPIEDQVYQAGTTPEGIHTMTVNPGFSGLKYFGVQVTPVTAHSGEEAVVFTHQRDEAQLSLNVIKADFDAVPEAKAQAGFNVLAGDVIKVYIVDDLTNDPEVNPIILQ